jgi:hypothetical protein
MVLNRPLGLSRVNPVTTIRSSRFERVPPAERGGHRRLPSAVSTLSLCSIGVVVLLVSLPSLRGLALRQNESDAVRVVRALGRASLATAGARARSIGELFRANPELEHRFGDLEYLEGPRLLRAHGYLFDLSRGPDGPTVRAWPWAWGRTGFAAFVHTAAGELLGHPNSEGTWNGCADAPCASRALPSGWREMR